MFNKQLSCKSILEKKYIKFKKLSKTIVTDYRQLYGTRQTRMGTVGVGGSANWSAEVCLWANRPPHARAHAVPADAVTVTPVSARCCCCCCCWVRHCARSPLLSDLVRWANQCRVSVVKRNNAHRTHTLPPPPTNLQVRRRTWITQRVIHFQLFNLYGATIHPLASTRLYFWRVIIPTDWWPASGSDATIPFRKDQPNAT